MEKIQQLLNEHKDKLWGWWTKFTIWTRNTKNHSKQIMITHEYHIYQWRWEVQYSLSDLLFNTPFLSWLNWLYTPVDRDLICWDSNLYRDDWAYEQVSQRLTESDYHKINLALLSTDSERIAYLESNLF